mmetsp:Transcript_52644/g.129161  ORF Transcript_52644/g.129161 Transcript_52644/m.129161 type:complete len:295 (+) Transcript_52644:805-1689(+)
MPCLCGERSGRGCESIGMDAGVLNIQRRDNHRGAVCGVERLRGLLHSKQRRRVGKVRLDVLDGVWLGEGGKEGQGGGEVLVGFLVAVERGKGLRGARMGVWGWVRGDGGSEVGESDGRGILGERRATGGRVARGREWRGKGRWRSGGKGRASGENEGEAGKGKRRVGRRLGRGLDCASRRSGRRGRYGGHAFCVPELSHKPLLLDPGSFWLLELRGLGLLPHRGLWLFARRHVNPLLLQESLGFFPHSGGRLVLHYRLPRAPRGWLFRFPGLHLHRVLSLFLLASGALPLLGLW